MLSYSRMQRHTNTTKHMQVACEFIPRTGCDQSVRKSASQSLFSRPQLQPLQSPSSTASPPSAPLRSHRPTLGATGSMGAMGAIVAMGATGSMLGDVFGGGDGGVGGDGAMEADPHSWHCTPPFGLKEQLRKTPAHQIAFKNIVELNLINDL